MGRSGWRNGIGMGYHRTVNTAIDAVGGGGRTEFHLEIGKSIFENDRMNR